MLHAACSYTKRLLRLNCRLGGGFRPTGLSAVRGFAVTHCGDVMIPVFSECICVVELFHIRNTRQARSVERECRKCLSSIKSVPLWQKSVFEKFKFCTSIRNFARLQIFV